MRRNTILSLMIRSVFAGLLGGIVGAVVYWLSGMLTRQDHTATDILSVAVQIGLFALVIALITGVFQSWKTAQR